MKKARVIVVSGVTASEKTTFIQKVANLCPGTAVLSFDDYSIDALPSAPSSEALLKEPYFDSILSLAVLLFIRIFSL